LLDLLDEMAGRDPYDRDRSALGLLIVGNPQDPGDKEQENHTSENYRRGTDLLQAISSVIAHTTFLVHSVSDLDQQRDLVAQVGCVLAGVLFGGQPVPCNLGKFDCHGEVKPK
jgi:hypothetical protein